MIGNSRKEIKRIIKDNVGDMGHIDCHYLPKNIIKDNFKDRYYLIGLIDEAQSRGDVCLHNITNEWL